MFRLSSRGIANNPNCGKQKNSSKGYLSKYNCILAHYDYCRDFGLLPLYRINGAIL